MIYPKNIKEKLGFDQILDLTAQECETERAKALLPAVKFLNDRDAIRQRLMQTYEMKQILENSALQLSLPIDFVIDKKTASAIGFYYLEEELVMLMDALRSISLCLSFFSDKKDSYPELSALFEGIDIDLSIVDVLEKSLDRDGKIKPNASKKLEKIYAEIQKLEKSIIRKSNDVFNLNKEKGYLAETELSIKNGRVVLPVLSEHKRKLDGLLIDQSASGKISYIEPLALVTINNELSELYIKKQQEIVAILRNLTKSIVPYLSDIDMAFHQLAYFDFTRAKARLSIKFNWNLPEINAANQDIKMAVHPLLKIHLDEEGKAPVPLNISFNDEQRIIVISGPNAGGKSVALKTVGLLQYMLQSGYLIPVDPSSSFKQFDNIFVDIGDDQSIESDLSTYSSHLTAAKHIVNFSDQETLVLMDEIGTGTDPMFGGPMAEAILEEIHDKQAFGLITTHFSNIKTKATSLENAVNAAMLFDVKKLVPLYSLNIGQAGSSFAYEVAKNIGLNKKLIAKAKKYTNTKQYDLDSLLAEVQQQKEELDKELRVLEETKSKAKIYEEEYLKLKGELEKQKQQILKQAKKEAEAILSEANKDIERTIRVIKESKADKQQTAKVRKQISDKRTDLQSTVKEEVKAEFKVGDKVQIIDTESVGEIVGIQKNKAELVVGSVTTKINLNRLQKVGASQKSKVKKYISRSSFAERQKDFNPELDVRGKRTEEAIRLVDQWIDSAIILGFSELRLIHGKGYGILKQQIREHLKPNTAVKSIAYESIQLGGDGVSLIQLK